MSGGAGEGIIACPAVEWRGVIGLLYTDWGRHNIWDQAAQ